MSSGSGHSWLLSLYCWVVDSCISNVSCVHRLSFFDLSGHASLAFLAFLAYLASLAFTGFHIIAGSVKLGVSVPESFNKHEPN